MEELYTRLLNSLPGKTDQELMEMICQPLTWVVPFSGTDMERSLFRMNAWAAIVRLAHERQLLAK